MTAVRYPWALEEFKRQNFNLIVHEGREQLQSHGAEIANDPGLIKLADITLRAAFRLRNVTVADELLSIVGCLSPLAHFAAGVNLFRNDPRAAWFHLANASPYRPEYHGYWSLGLNSIVRSEEWVTYSNPNRFSARRVVAGQYDSAAAGKEYAVVFSCDRGYFKRFFKGCIDGLRISCSNFIAFFYVIDPDEECKALMRESAGSDVGFLIETTPERAGDKSYYASARFFAAADTIDRTGLPVLVLDIDIGVQADLRDLCLQAGFGRKTVAFGERVSCRFMSGLMLPWHHIVANAMYVPANATGRAFLDLVCRYIGHIYDRSTDERLWWIDQNALFFAHMASDADGFEKLSNRKLEKCIKFPKMFQDKDRALSS